MTISEITQQIKDLTALALDLSRVPQVENNQYGQSRGGFLSACKVLDNINALTEMQFELIKIESVNSKTALRLISSGSSNGN